MPHRHHLAALWSALLGLSILACIAPEGGSQGSAAGSTPARWDVRGNYTLAHQDALTITLNIGGVERRATAAGPDEVVDLGMHMGEPLTLDLAEYCAKEEVTCPSEALWSKISIDQQNVAQNLDAHIINVIDNTSRDLPAGARAAVLGGLLNHKDSDRFLLGIESASSSQGDCGALAISLAGGRFERAGESMETVTTYKDAAGKVCEPTAAESEECMAHEHQRLVIPPDGKITGIAQGKVAIGWLGACAFGPVLAGATLSIETQFTGVRTGDFDPPAFTPIESPDVPDQDMGAPDMS